LCNLYIYIKLNCLNCMRNRRYEAFTLVEMLIVMGILIILMVIGIAAGRFALNRANDVAHQNAADQLYQGLQAYYTDHRVFPTDECKNESGATVDCTPMNMMEDDEILGKYLDMGEFNGGTAATFIYFVGGDNSDQAVFICVSMRGIQEDSDARDDGAYYCTGNGFGAEGMSSGGIIIDIEKKTIEKGDDDWSQFFEKEFGLASNWDSVEGVMQWTAY
jgi:type II secretory pathway pseudopilin PulG